MRRALDWLVVDAVGRAAGVNPHCQPASCAPATPVCNRTQPGMPDKGWRERHAQSGISSDTVAPQTEPDPRRH